LHDITIDEVNEALINGDKKLLIDNNFDNDEIDGLFELFLK